VTFIAKNTL